MGIVNFGPSSEGRCREGCQLGGTNAGSFCCLWRWNNSFSWRAFTCGGIPDWSNGREGEGLEFNIWWEESDEKPLKKVKKGKLKREPLCKIFCSCGCNEVLHCKFLIRFIWPFLRGRFDRLFSRLCIVRGEKVAYLIWRNWGKGAWEVIVQGPRPQMHHNQHP